MSIDHNYPSDAIPRPGLPTVVPPSGRFMVQLFLVPFLIVSCIIGFLLLINWWVGGPRSPEYFLAKLDDPNADIRWRGAEELAQVLQRDRVLAANPKFAGDLTERLIQARKELDENPAKPTDSGTQLPGQKQANSQREYVLYLGACVGNMTAPVGTPILCEIGVLNAGADTQWNTRRRWWSLWTLAKQGDLIQKSANLRDASFTALVGGLRDEAAAPDKGRADRAQNAFAFLTSDGAPSLGLLGVDKALLMGAADPNPFVREVAAFAMNYWYGTAKENAQLDEALAKLSYDDGRGEELLAQMRESESPSLRPLTKTPGLQVRYNAAVALGRRASSKVRLAVIKEMLDESQQRENFHLKRPDGTETVDESMVAKTLEAALLATSELHRKDPKRDLSSLLPSIEKLTEIKNPAIKLLAEQTWRELKNP